MTDRYAVFGNPIEHSKSPAIHRQFAEQTAQAIDYQRQKVALDGFGEAVRHFFAGGGRGLNVTVPFKLEAFQLADVLTTRAQTAGAVNTLWQDAQGQLWGDNTDGIGLVSDITDNLGWSLTDKTVLILGAGGAVRGILQPLLEQHPAQVFVANRTAAKAQDLAATFAELGSIAGGGFEAVSTPFDVIINGTSASISGELPPIAPQVIQANSHCYDMMYGAEPTVFLTWAQQLGCTQLADGLGMLVGQAAESFKIWRGVKPQTTPVIKALRETI